MLEWLKECDDALFVMLNGSDSLYWDGFMWVVTKTQTWIPLMLMVLYVVVKNGTLRRLLLIVACLALTVLLADRLSSGLIKPLVQRWRPTHSATFVDSLDTVFGYTGGRFGFVSSHAANTFSVALFLSLLFRYRPLSLLLFLWAAVASYSRVYLGVHYPGDILCGALLGLLVGGLVYLGFATTERKMHRELQYFSASYTRSGFLTSDLKRMMAAIVCIFAAALIAAIFVAP